MGLEKVTLTNKDVGTVSDQQLYDFLVLHDKRSFLDSIKSLRTNEENDDKSNNPQTARLSLENRVLKILNAKSTSKIDLARKVDNSVLNALRITEQRYLAQQDQLIAQTCSFTGEAQKIQTSIAAAMKSILTTEIVESEQPQTKTTINLEPGSFEQPQRPSMNAAMFSALKGGKTLKKVAPGGVVSDARQKLTGILAKQTAKTTSIPAEKKSIQQIKEEKAQKINTILAVLDLLKSKEIPPVITQQIEELREIQGQLIEFQQKINEKQQQLMALESENSKPVKAVVQEEQSRRPALLSAIGSSMGNLKKSITKQPTLKPEISEIPVDPAKKLSLELDSSTKLRRLKSEYALDPQFKTAVDAYLLTKCHEEFGDIVLRDPLMKAHIISLFSKRQQEIDHEESFKRAQQQAEARRKAEEKAQLEIEQQLELLTANGIILTKSSAEPFIQDFQVKLAQTLTATKKEFAKISQIITKLDKAIITKQRGSFQNKLAKVHVELLQCGSSGLRKVPDTDSKLNAKSDRVTPRIKFGAEILQEKIYQDKYNLTSKLKISQDYNNVVANLVEYAKKVRSINKVESYFWEAQDEKTLNYICNELATMTVNPCTTITSENVKKIIELTAKTIQIANNIEKPSKTGYKLYDGAVKLAKQLCDFVHSVVVLLDLADKQNKSHAFDSINDNKQLLIREGQKLRCTPTMPR